MSVAHPNGRGRLRTVVGVAAIALLLLLALVTPRWGGLRQKAVVDANQTFRLHSLESGGHRTSLRSGWAAEGEALVWERALELERSDLVVLEINPELSPGDLVQEGQVVAWLRSPRNQRRLVELQAMRDRHIAQQDLIAAGKRDERIERRRQQLALARAAWEGIQPELSRTRALHQEGALSAAELEQIEGRERLLAMELEVASAALELVEAEARPERLEAAKARVEAVEARINELELRLEGETIRSPITGLLEMGGRRVVLRVYDLDPVYLRVALPEADRHRLQVGAAVRFRTQAVRDSIFEGEVVDISEDASPMASGQIFWVSAEVSNPEQMLRSGMSGVAQIELEVPRRGFLTKLWDELMGFGP